MKRTHLIRLCLLVALAAGLPFACKKAPVEPAPEHVLTPEEEKKSRLADSFDPFIQVLGVENLDDPQQFIQDHSILEMGLDGRPVYRLEKDMVVLLKIIFTPTEEGVTFDAYFYGGPFMSGIVRPTLSTDWKDWEKNWDIDVYDGEEAVAKLGVEELDGTPTPVFRFPDGTSYTVASFLLTESLIDYLIENGLPTE